MESLHGFCVSLLCGNAYANAGCERGPEKLLKTCYTLAMPLSVEQLFCGLGQRQLLCYYCYYASQMLGVPLCSAKGKGTLCHP